MAEHDEFVWRPRRRRRAVANVTSGAVSGEVGGDEGGDASMRSDSRVSRRVRVAFAEPEHTVIVEGLDPWENNDP